MYKWLIVGCVIGFGIGLLLASILFETWLSPYGDPIIIDYIIWHWSPQITMWKYIGIIWLLTGIIGTYFLYKISNKAESKRKSSAKKVTAISDKRSDVS